MSQVPTIEGEVERIENALLFGHYDSRGGATLLLNAEGVMKGIREYVNEFWGPADEMNADEEDSGFADLMDGSQGFVEVIVLGKELPRDGEVLSGYADKGAGWAWYEVSRKCAGHGDGGVHWSSMDVAVLRYVSTEEVDEHDGEDEEEVMNKLVEGIVPADDRSGEYRLEYADIGEDAFGLIVM